MIATVSALVLSAGFVVQATGGHLVAGGPDRHFASVSIDSRALPPESLFVALAGPSFDGHCFVPDVLARGAAVLVSEAWLVSNPSYLSYPSYLIVSVPDPLGALQKLGHAVRVQSGARVVAITGSAGKTTTKEIAADFLAARYRVFRNAGNLNNHIGLPLSLLELRHGAEIGVVELGMNHPGEIRALVRLAEPDVRLWTNVGDAHIGHFQTQRAIAGAKAEILEAAGPRTLLVANADDPLVMAHAARFTGRRLTFGEAPGADVRAHDVIDRGFDGTSCRVTTPAGPLALELSLAGRVQLSNVLAATAVAIEFDVPLEEVRERAIELHAVNRRGALASLSSGARLVDDSYNASPAAMKAMLAALHDTAVRGRRIAVLGEMLELGDASHALHEQCGDAAAAAGVDELVVVGGPAADGFAAGALARGMATSRIHRFASSDQAAAVVLDLVRGGDLVLVKGSRGTRTDLVADRLKAGV